MNYGSTEASFYANLAWKNLKIDGFYSYVKNDILGIIPNWQEKGYTTAPFRIFADAQYTFKLPKEWSIVADLIFNTAYDYPEFSKMWYNSLPMGPGISVYGSVALHF